MLGPTSPRLCSSRAASKYPTGPVLTGKGTSELHALRCGVSCGLAVSPRAGPASSELEGGLDGMQGVLAAGKGNTSTLAQLQHAKVPTSPEPPHGTGFVHACAHRAGDREKTSPPQQPFAEAPGKGQAAELLHGGRSFQAPGDAPGRPSAPRGRNQIVPMLLQPPMAGSQGPAQVSPPLPLPNHSSIPRGLGDAPAW